ncbi:MAG: response regulator transcription factor [Anaerolineae bacterium]
MTKILLVDDDPTGSSLLKMFLELENFSVTTVHDLEQARHALDENTRLVLLDYHLSRNVSGLLLLEEIRAGKTDSAKETPVIITSGDDRANQASIEQGANAFMHKPFGPSDLVAVIHTLI